MKNILTAMLLGLTALVHSQNTITGTVTDGQNLPLSGVSVYVQDISQGTATNALGKYTIPDVPLRTLTITFTYIGYKPVNKITLVENETIIDIVLEEDTHQLDEVIVSTAFNKMQSQNVMKVEHATIKSMRQKGIATLIEGLAAIPGVSQISTGTSIGKPVIRGLSSNRVLVYSQGVRIENQQFGDEHGLGLNDSGIESVEVIKGPASLLYGSDALGGVLYMNPEKFADAKTFKGDVSQKYYSNTVGSNLSIGLKGSTANWKFLGRGSFSTHSDYKIPSGFRITNTRYNESDLKAGIGYANSKFSSVLRYNFNRLDIGIPEDGVGFQSESKKTLFPKQGVDNHITSLHNNFYFRKSNLEVDLGYMFNDRSEFEDSDDALLRMKLRTVSYDIKYHFPKMGQIETIAGIQGMFQQNKNFAPEFLIPDAVIRDMGIFATANYEWKKNVIQGGLRFDNRNLATVAHGDSGTEGYFEKTTRSFDSFNASFGYKGNLTPESTIRINLASGFRAPNLAELTSNGVHEGTNRYEIGNNSLKKEQNVQTDVNIEYKGDHFEFFINGFYNHINDYIFAAPTGAVIDENNVFAYIQSNAFLYGGETGLHFHPHPLDWLHFESSFESVTGKKNNGAYLPLIPANKWNNTIRTEFKIKKWLSEGFARLNVTTTFNQQDVSGFETKSLGYTLLNAGFGGKIKVGKYPFEVSVNANNLLDETYIAHLSRLKPDGIPNIGRNIIFGLNFNI